MKQQIQIYSLDTRAFYTKAESEISVELSWYKSEKYAIEDYALFSVIIRDFDIITEKKDIQFIGKYTFKNYSDFREQREDDRYLKKFVKKLLKDNKYLKKSDEYKQELIKFPLHEEFKNKISKISKKLTELIKNSDNKLVRRLNPNVLKKYNKVSIFESAFTRTLGFRINETTTDIMIVKVTDKKFYPIMEQLVNNSFAIYNENDRFVALTATAGQIRVKKIIFIREYVYREYIEPLMCGLTIDKINELGGCNVNKFLAYLGLIFSDSDKWEGFDINKAIVINDFETMVNGEVDYIDNKTFTVTPQFMDIPIIHSDGCGWILPSESKVNFQFRAPWCKGLLTPLNYLLYCEKFNDGNYEVVDIYGKTWDLKKDDIKYVFSKSQFKMWKYYPNILNEDGSIKYGWDTYKENFIKYECHASKCHEETGKYKNGRFNYQMMQTLTDVSDDELDELIKPTKDLITGAYTDKDTMLEVLGAGNNNPKKNNLQRALEIYPELLNDSHVKDELMDAISAKRNDAKFARIKIDAKSTFIIPDVFAWLQYVFSKDKTINPKGLLANGEVYCRLYKKSPEIICNRSPHLWREHAVRKNVANEFIGTTWYITDGLYTSTHDLISKLLQFDNDGDASLVIGDENLITVIKRNMKDVLPLYYEMGKADPEIITNKSIFESIKAAWKYGNIGAYSNTLTKFWNNYNKDSDLDLAKIVCALNNYSIDAAKTKMMPNIPKEIKEKIKAIKELDMPYFAQFAKDELEGKVSERNESTVNRLCAKIEEIKIQDYDFSRTGKFKKAMLMRNSRIVVNEAVAKMYDELNDLKDSYFRDAKRANLTKDEVATSIYTQIKNELLQAFPELGVVEITDMIIKHILKNHKDHKKTFLFNCFGDIIVESLKKNLEGTIQCSKCGCRVKLTGRNQKMCPDCAREENRKKAKERIIASRKLNKAV